MINLALPVITGILDVLKSRQRSLAKTAGVPENLVADVLTAAKTYATKDERLQQQIAEQFQNARAHDIATFDKADIASNRLRSSVRPLVTFAAMSWYIYARLNEIPLLQEDYAIIGGILAFWFGFRPFEKRKNAV